ncbi:MAG: HNH endonuclease [Bryobacteraceae bacterium]
MNVREPSGRDKLRTHLKANVGRILGTQQLREIAGISEYARRIRELRDEEGMQIKTHKERPDLRPDEYILESLDLAPVANPKVPVPLRKTALLRDGPRCRFCGANWNAGSNPANAPRVKLRIDYLDPLEDGGLDRADNVGVICALCAKGRHRARRQGQSARDLLALIRRAAPAVQREVYVALKRSFEDASRT